jgi:hypothetical protein
VAHERQEGGLEGVVGLGVPPQDPSGDVPHHRPVPPDEHLERGRIPLFGEAPQQLGVGDVGEAVARGGPAEALHQTLERAGHGGLRFTAVLRD